MPHTQQRFPLYQTSDPIYGQHGEIKLPLAVVEKVHQTEKARLMYNVFTQQESWFPESVFVYHWHCVSATEMMIFLSLSESWVKKKKEFFRCT